MAGLQSEPEATPASVRGAVPLVALAPISLLLSSGTVRADLAKLTILGSLFTIFLLFSGKVWFPGGADQFMQYADAIAHGATLPPSLAERDAGYPLLILLGGYTWLHSLIPIFLVQALFAIVLPLLVYEGIRRLSPTAAFYAGLVSVISLSPFLFMKMMHHDQSYIFFSVLMLSLLLIFVQTRRARFLYLFTVAAICASISRPAGNALFPMFLVVSYVAVRGHGLHYLTCLAAFIVFLAAYSWHRHVIFDVAHTDVTASYVGAQTLYNPYLNTLDYDITLSPREVGPYFTLSLKQLRNLLNPNPKDSEFIRLHYLGSPAEKQFAEANMFPYSPDELIEQILKHPNYEYYTLICEANDDHVLLLAALEIARAYPTVVARYAERNLFHFIFDPGYSHTRYNFKPFSPVGLIFFPVDGPVAGDLSVLPARAVREINFDSTWSRPTIVDWLLHTLQRAWLHIYRSATAVLACLMMGTWAIAIAGLAGVARWRPSHKSSDALQMAASSALAGALLTSIIIASLVFLYNAAVTAVFVEPDFRYRQMVDLEAILIAGLGLASIPYCLNVVLEPTLAARVIGRWERAAELTYAYDIWRRRTAMELAVIAIGAAVAGLAAWTLFMLSHTLS